MYATVDALDTSVTPVWKRVIEILDSMFATAVDNAAAAVASAAAWAAFALVVASPAAVLTASASDTSAYVSYPLVIRSSRAFV